MADPFEGLDDDIAGCAPLPLQPGTTAVAAQSSASPQPDWPGVNAPTAGGATATTSSHQYQRTSSPSVGGTYLPAGHTGFHPNHQLHHNIMMGNAPVASSTGHVMIQPAGQQQPMMATAAETSWGGGGMMAPSLLTATHDAGRIDLGGSNPNVALHAQQATTRSTAAATAAAAAATSPSVLQMRTSANEKSGGGVGGAAGAAAEWTPPADEMSSYEEMWTTASADCAVPDTVSGRAAVQFFSRSGLPKDTLKTIWSLCDPSLTGSIRRPGFFAAMRLIAIAQQQRPPSVSALEATRYSPLPLPRMGSFSPPSSGVAGAGASRGLPSVTATATSAAAATAAGSSYAVAAATPSPPSRNGLPAPGMSAAVVAAAGRGGGRGGAVKGGSSGLVNTVGDAATPVWGAATDRGIGGGGGGGNGASSSLSLSAEPATGSRPRVESAQQQHHAPPAGMTGMMTTVPPAERVAPEAGGETAGPGHGDEDEEEEEDFGDFAGAQDETQPQSQPQQQPAPSFSFSSTEQESDDDGDDFGNFSSAPTFMDVAATVAPAPAPAATTGAPGGACMPAVHDGNGIGAGKGGGLDDLINSSLQPTTVAGQVHLADLQTTPPLAGKPQDPVMADRASIAQSKLSVFDAMADMDLAVGQEDWNDFADETTAPPRSPTPPPPPAPASPPNAAPDGIAATAGAATAAVVPDATATAAGGESGDTRGDVFAAADGDRAAEGTHDASQPRTLPHQEPSLGSGSVGGGLRNSSPLVTVTIEGQQQKPCPVSGRQESTPPFSPPEGTAEVIAAAPVAKVLPLPAPEKIQAEDQDEDWGDFEDAAGGKEGGGGAAGTGGGGDSTAAPGADDDGDEEWGMFVDVPAGEEAAAAAVDVEGLHDLEDKSTEATEENNESGTSGSGRAGSPELPEEAADPFAEIAPPTPPGVPPSAHPDDNEQKAAAAAEGPEEVERTGRIGSFGGPEEGSAPTGASTTTTGAPLSLGGLRDALAGRGRLEEAVEVQQRMELPPAPTSSASLHVETVPDDNSSVPGEAGGDGGESEVGDRDLERWRAALELPPSATVDELAETMSAADAALGERFRASFVSGRPPVEEEAVATGGGLRALNAAVKRQRAARRAVFLSSVLGSTSVSAPREVATENVAYNGGGEDRREEVSGGQTGKEVELELDLGLDSRGARPPPTMSDWAILTAHVTRMATEGLAVLNGGGGGGDGSHGGATAGPVPSTPRPTLLDREDAAGAAAADTDAFAAGAGTTTAAAARGGTAVVGMVSGEVARSEKFESFARGLREAVKVCRMMQAAAEDGCCLEGVDGFASMERAWAELRRSARQALGGVGDSIGDDDEYLRYVFGAEDGEGEGGREGGGTGKSHTLEGGRLESSVSKSGGGGNSRDSSAGGIACASVKAVREACVERAPAGSALCAVCLQPLVVFSDGGGGGGGERGSGSCGGFGRPPPPSGVVEYCGVRYLACAVNLWVNVLDKPPPGPLPLPEKNVVV